MSEERLQEIKDSVNFQREFLLAHNMGTLCVDEEQELIEEIERLKEQLQQKENIIKEVREEIIKDRKKSYGNLAKKAFYCNKTDKLLEILDKEVN